MDVDQLREGRGQGVVAFTKFTLLEAKHGSGIFCCFEGEDSKYYLKRIETITKSSIDNIIPFNCGGKTEVIRFHGLVQRAGKYDHVRLGYFIDRDFDNSVLQRYHGKVYETPCYSVENLYTTQDALKRILKCEFQMNEADEDYECCIGLYIARQAEFHEHIKLLNAWLWCQKDLFNSGKSSRLNWDKFKLSKIVPVITLDQVVTNQYNQGRLENDLFPTATKVDPDTVAKKVQEIELENYQSCFRGKFEIEFLYCFIDAMKAEMVLPGGRISKRNGIHINISKSNILSELSIYACTPDCLQTYIARLA